ncbi:MAG: type I glyceraldehyde-3-phosphate dehydrogenase [Candidatus Aenigmatarchaeota archaeon]
MVNVGINGFGRIGRMILKAGLEDSEVDLLAINDIAPPENLAYLLKHDSVYGNYDKKVQVKDGKLLIGDKRIKFFNEKNPEYLPWKDLGVDIAVESSGVFRHVDDAKKHLEAGAEKVLISAPSKGGGKFIVYGVNDDEYNKNKHDIISNASCTTNSLAPVVKVLNESLGIEKGQLTTVHGYTASQNLIDGPKKKVRRGRSAAENIVPTSTGAATAVTKVIPELKNKLDGIALRVPVPCGSISDFVCHTNQNTSVEEVNNILKKASRNKMHGIMDYTEDELVSRDILQNPHSSVVDSKMTNVVDKNQVKVLAWYDNEWGFSNRMIDVLKMLL